MNEARFQMIAGDITAVPADAIVNSTDPSCSGAGGLDRAIHKAAGSALAAALGTGRKPEEGQAIITPAFEIRTAKWIIHTVGPKWKKGFDMEEYTLAECYRNSLRIAAEHNCRSIAFPCISVGAKGFPPDRAAEIAVRSVINALRGMGNHSCIEQVLFVCPEGYTGVYSKHLKAAIIDAFLQDYAPESVPRNSFGDYYAYMKALAVLEWGDLKHHRQYHSGFGAIDRSNGDGCHSKYDHYVKNIPSWDYNTCLAFLIAIFRPPYTYDGTGLMLPQFIQLANGAVRRVLIRMKTLL